MKEIKLSIQDLKNSIKSLNLKDNNNNNNKSGINSFLINFNF